MPPGLQLGDQLAGGLLLVVLVQREHLGTDAMRIEQAATVAGVLGGHPVHRAQHIERAQRDVAQVPERRGDHIQ